LNWFGWTLSELLVGLPVPVRHCRAFTATAAPRASTPPFPALPRFISYLALRFTHTARAAVATLCTCRFPLVTTHARGCRCTGLTRSGDVTLPAVYFRSFGSALPPRTRQVALTLHADYPYRFWFRLPHALCRLNLTCLYTCIWQHSGRGAFAICLHSSGQHYLVSTQVYYIPTVYFKPQSWFCPDCTR